MSRSEPAQLRYRNLQPGDAAPWFEQASTTNPRYKFDTAAGRYILMCFFGTAGDAAGRAAIEAVQAHRQLFDDTHACFFGISADPEDRSAARVRGELPGIRYFWDFDCRVAGLFGAVPGDVENPKPHFRRLWFVLDPNLRVRAVFPFDADGGAPAQVFEYLRALPPVSAYPGFEVQAPILTISNVFEPELCRHLIDLYERNGGADSGFMRTVEGKTVLVNDHRHKVRKDYLIEDEGLMAALQGRFARRVRPEIEKIHFFQATRMERFIVSCYSAEDGGHFRPHRDNTTMGTAHRRFAVTINLNAAFDGGELAFPEYGPRGYKPPPGTAIVFSCSLLHAVSPVTAGRRFAFLPFLYDDEAAALRERNSSFLLGAGRDYRAART
ncbi:MAG TPA: 2OG-Fe(II) oxygenase [Ramlibacter sp.]|uniref:2OG-Fe(II) oxygenase n=1 Tax=Ramlibacter sp. TaxID=1917967 RepID=UPI002ED2F263